MFTFQSSKTVLCYGHDAVLQKTRRWLVESVGGQCINVTDLASYIHAIKQMQFTAIVLCHSLEPEERFEALHLAEQNCPSATAIVMYRMGSKGPSGERLVAFDSGEGAEAFIHAVKNIFSANADA